MKKNKNLIHISALGLENIKDSDYAKSKILGENRIRELLKTATIIKPSVVFSVMIHLQQNLWVCLAIPSISSLV